MSQFPRASRSSRQMEATALRTVAWLPKHFRVAPCGRSSLRSLSPWPRNLVSALAQCQNNLSVPVSLSVLFTPDPLPADLPRHFAYLYEELSTSNTQVAQTQLPRKHLISLLRGKFVSGQNNGVRSYGLGAWGLQQVGCWLRLVEPQPLV